MNEAPAAHFRMPDVTVLERQLSTSGKYFIFLGLHYEKGHTCWVVGASSKMTGLVTMRHYNSGIEGCVAPRAQAYTYWETFKSTMIERKEDGHEETELEGLDRYIEEPGNLTAQRKLGRPN